MGETRNPDKGDGCGEGRNQDITAPGEPQRTAGAPSPEVPPSDGRSDSRSFLLDLAPYAGPILYGVAANVAELVKLIQG